MILFLTRIVLPAIVAWACLTTTSVAGRWRIQQITDNSVDDIEPDIDGQNIVWATSIDSYHYHEDYAIAMFDGDRIRFISDPGGFNQRGPRIDGDIVAWSNYVEGWTVTIYDGTRAFNLPKTEYGAHNHLPVVDDGRVIFIGGGAQDYDIFLYENGSTRAVTSDHLRNVSPVISGDRIVWNRGVGYTMTEIVMLSEGEIRILASVGLPFGVTPDFDGESVVWYGPPKSLNPFDWYLDTDAWEIFVFDGSTTNQITSNDWSDFSAVVAGRNVAWFQATGVPGELDLMVFDGYQTTKVASSVSRQLGIAIDGSSIVWSAFDGNDNEIYLATPVPEPSGVLLAAAPHAACNQGWHQLRPGASTMKTIEERLAALESEVAEIKRQLADNAKPRAWLADVAGSLDKNPEFDEAMRLGREWRQSMNAEHSDQASSGQN